MKILHELLKAECPDHLSRYKRDVATDAIKAKHEVDTILYERMIRMLVECRKSKLVDDNQLSSNSSGTILPTSSTAQISECLTAINLTEPWRQFHNGSGYKPDGKSNCDTSTMIGNGRPWFRFTGMAGNTMLDHCIPDYSCGSSATIWTNAAKPSEVGVKMATIVYVSWANRCKSDTQSAEVIRCSDATYDLIYRYNDIP